MLRRLRFSWVTSRPRIKKQLGFKSCYLIGAINPATGDKTGIIFTTLDTDVMNLFFKELSSNIPDEHHAIIVWDGAGFHRSKDFKVPDNIAFRMLPTYSPELNQSKELAMANLGNSVYNDLEDLFKAGANAWNNLTNEIIKSVCKVNWLPT